MADASPFRRAAGRGASVAVAAAALALLAAAPAGAAEPGVSLQGGWMRMLIPSRPAGGYFTLRNSGGQYRMLTGASSPACGSVMLHESEHDGGTERMVMVPKLKLPAHGALTFAPGGYHLMCMHPGPAMRAGAKVPMTLTFADGGSLSAPFVVKGALDK